MRNKRWLCGLLALVLLFSLTAAGCNRDIDSEGRKILHVWHCWDQSDSPFYSALDAALKTYQTDHPELVIETHTLKELDYKAQLATSFNEGGKNIDIFAFWGGGQLDQLVESDLLLPMDKYLTESVTGGLLPNSFAAFTRGGKKYAAPSYGWVNTLYCNTELFTQQGVALPQTLQDLTENAYEFTKKELVPLSVGGEDSWQLTFLFETILLRTAGGEQVLSFLDGKAELADTEAFSAATELFASLRTGGTLGKTPAKVNSEMADDTFLENMAAARMTGSWLVGRIEAMDDTDFAPSVKVLPFPQVIAAEGGQPTGSLTEHVGGFSQSFFVNNRTSHKDESAALCLYLTEVLGNAAEQSGLGVSAWTKEPAGATALQNELSALVKGADMLVPSWDVLLPTQHVDPYVTAVRDVFSGKLTTLEFLNKLKQYVQKEAGA